MVSFHRSAQTETDESPESEAASRTMRTDPRSSAATFPRVNLMPDVVAAEARVHRAQMMLVGAAVASVAVVGALYLVTAGSVSESQDRLDAAQATTAQLSSEQAKYADVPQVQAQVAAAAAQQNSALGGEVRWSVLLNNLALTLPAGTSLVSFNGTVSPTPTAVTPAGAVGATTAAGSATGTAFTSVLGNPGIGTISYAGEAAGYQQVANFLTSQAKQKQLLDPYVNSATASTDPTTKALAFTSTATVTAAALSHRYDLKAGS